MGTHADLGPQGEPGASTRLDCTTVTTVRPTAGAQLTTHS